MIGVVAVPAGGVPLVGARVWMVAFTVAVGALVSVVAWSRRRLVAQAASLAAQQEQLREQASRLAHANRELAGTIQSGDAAREIAEAAVAEYEALLAAMTDVILVLSAQGRYLHVSNTGAARPVRPAPELIGRLMHDVMPAALADDFLEVIRETLRSGTPRQHEYQLEIDGEQAWFSASIAPLPDERVVWVARDVTEARRARAALSESEERYRQLVDQAPYGVLVHAGGTITFANPAAAAMLGSEPGALVGVPALDIVHPADRERVGAGITGGVVRRAATPLTEQQLLRRDGTVLDVEATGIPFEIGGVDATQLVFRDVGPRKRLEAELRQAQKMEAVGQLAGGVAHDFNNMLTVITSYSGMLLLELPDDAAARADVAEIQGAARRAAALTRQLLAFSRQQVLDPRVLDLNDVTREMDRLLRRVIREDVQLRSERAPELGHVYADPWQVEQVIMNLVVNARDAMAEGGTLTIVTADVELDGRDPALPRTVPPGEYVMLSVTDTGMGMSAATQARIFEPFFTTKVAGQGTGLGLSTVYGIVTQSDGYVAVRSELGRGTTFEVYLPTVDEPRTARPASGRHTVVRRGSETLLLVEDDPQVRAAARRILERSGYRVLDAASGAEGLRAFEAASAEVSLVVTDLVMPEMGGRELVTRVRALRPAMAVLLMSGYTSEAHDAHPGPGPEEPFLRKPFTPQALTRAVAEALGRPE